MRVLKSDKFRKLQEESPEKAKSILKRAFFFRKSTDENPVEIDGKQYVIKRLENIHHVEPVRSVE